MVIKFWDIKPFRFVCVGIVSTANDLLILNILVFLIGLNPVAANFISSSVAIVISYFLNNILVFQKQFKPSMQQFVRFFIVTGLSIVLVQTVIIYGVTHVISETSMAAYSGLTETQAKLVIVNGAKVFAVIAGMVWNYGLYNLVVFKKQKTNNVRHGYKEADNEPAIP